jgi:hypothetical protein
MKEKIELHSVEPTLLGSGYAAVIVCVVTDEHGKYYDVWDTDPNRYRTREEALVRAIDLAAELELPVKSKSVDIEFDVGEPVSYAEVGVTGLDNNVMWMVPLDSIIEPTLDDWDADFGYDVGEPEDLS